MFGNEDSLNIFLVGITFAPFRPQTLLMAEQDWNVQIIIFEASQQLEGLHNITFKIKPRHSSLNQGLFIKEFSTFRSISWCIHNSFKTASVSTHICT